MNPADYHPVHGLPPLAGLATFEEARKPGLSVEESTRRLKRLHYAFRRLHGIFVARIAAEPIYELKMAFSLHAHTCAEHATALRVRVGEMREPPLGLDVVPDPALEIFFDEMLMVPETETLILALYCKAVEALGIAIRQYQREVNPLADAPSLRVLRFAALEVDDMFDYGRKAAVGLMGNIGRAVSGSDDGWFAYMNDLLVTAGGITGPAPGVAVPVRRLSAQPYRYDPVPRRDERFPDPYNMGVNAEVFLHDPEMPASAKCLMMYYRRIREIDVPEMMSSILMETPGKPWNYTRDMTRQIWDEARHAMMGEVGFLDVGVDWHKVMINFTWSLGLNTQLTAMERHGVLYYIEQGQMPKTGKRYEWETAIMAANPLAATFQDFDWADEVLHSRIGRDWYVSEFPSGKEAVDYGDQCWSKVLIGWREWRDQGKTLHRNWWPEVYREACANQGREPDPKVMAYSESYETKRADLKTLPVSG